MEREGARERAKERESERDLKLSCNLCNFCHLRMRPGKGVDSCHRGRDRGQGRGAGAGAGQAVLLLCDKATHLFCKYCVRN